MYVGIRGGLIEFVTPISDAPPPCDSIVDLTGLTVLPGMIDMHVHVDYYYIHLNYREFTKGDGLIACLGARNIRSTLEKGMTSVRNLGSGQGLNLRRAVELGYLQGSRVFTSAKGICMTGGHGHEMHKGIRETDGVDEMRRAVREQSKAGCDLIKILTSHRSELPEFRQEELGAGVDEAHRLGYKVACHAAIMSTAKMAVLAGVDSIEHGTHLTDAVRFMMAERGSILFPT